MPLDTPLPARITALNARYKHHSATSVMEKALRDADLGRIALVSSFGAESVVLLHMVSLMARNTPVLFIDTEMLFAETLAYQLEVSERLRLGDVRTIRAERAQVFERDNEGLLHLHDPDACCALRKTEPLAGRPQRLRQLDHRAQTLSGQHPGQPRILRIRGRHPDQGEPARPLDQRRSARLHGRETGCPGTPWWPRAIRRSVARRAPPAWATAKTPAPGAGAI
jgi:hypothetical protein